MAEQQYDLYFRGELLDGHFADFVKADIQTLFKANADYVDKLFSGQDNLIKRQVDKATAIKFQQAFKKAGAKLIVRAHGSKPAAPAPAAPSPSPSRPQQTKPTAAQTAAPAAAAQKAPAAKTAAQASTPLSAASVPAGPGEGADELIEHHQPDIHAPEQVPNWDVAAPGTQLLAAKAEVNVDIDTSEFSVAETGADLLITSGFEEPAPVINTSAISLAEVGGVIETLDDKPAPVRVDISHLSVE